MKDNCLTQLNNIINIDINKIKINENRIRTTTDKNLDDLISSIKEFGLFHPVLINKNNQLISGYRRLMACKALNWKSIVAIIRNDTDELKEINIELQENLRRKDLTPYEIDIATAKWKRIYEIFHPETKYLAHVKSGKRDSKGRIMKRNQVVNPATLNESNYLDTSRFTNVASKYCNASERTIRDRVQIGEAILNGFFDDKTIQLYKSGQIKHTKMVILDRKLRKEKKNEKTIKEIDLQKPFSLLLKNEFEQIRVKSRGCIECKKAVVTICPNCHNQVIICKRNNFIIKQLNSPKCEYFS